MNLRPGDKVTYVTNYKQEPGIVKSVRDDAFVFVVYNCDDDWVNYDRYTAALTHVGDLVKGWI